MTSLRAVSFAGGKNAHTYARLYFMFKLRTTLKNQNNFFFLLYAYFLSFSTIRTHTHGHTFTAVFIFSWMTLGIFSLANKQPNGIYVYLDLLGLKYTARTDYEVMDFAGFEKIFILYWLIDGNVVARVFSIRIVWTALNILSFYYTVQRTSP